MIKHIKLTNFKSFEKLDLELGKFNVLIGANASGKSNFVQIFKFLRDIVKEGLDNAISWQGGIEYLRNINIGTSDNLSLCIDATNIGNEVLIETKHQFINTQRHLLIDIKAYEITNEFVLSFKQKSPRYTIAKDRATYKCEFSEFKGKTIESRESSKGEISWFRDNGKIRLELSKLKNSSITEKDILQRDSSNREKSSTTLLLENPSLFFGFNPRHYLGDISIYDFDPKLPKKAIPLTGKAELEEDGNNLSIILKNIIKDKDKRRKLFNLVQDLLPFIKKLGVEDADKSLLFKSQETYYKQDIPAYLMSDGTINITSLIIALYFGKHSFKEGQLSIIEPPKEPLTIIEEPERNIHPNLISKVVDMMKEASQKKQIIVTTHNPEVIKHAGIENILFVSRDKEGFSVISRPADKKEVQTFLKNEIGIEELYVQNLL